jgi:hypothetical protein
MELSDFLDKDRTRLSNQQKRARLRASGSGTGTGANPMADGPYHDPGTPAFPSTTNRHGMGNSRLGNNILSPGQWAASVRGTGAGVSADMGAGMNSSHTTPFRPQPQPQPLPGSAADYVSGILPLPLPLRSSAVGMTPMRGSGNMNVPHSSSQQVAYSAQTPAPPQRGGGGDLAEHYRGGAISSAVGTPVPGSASMRRSIAPRSTSR